MYDKHVVEQMLKSIVWINGKMGIWAFIIPVVFAILVLYQIYRSYKKPSTKNNRILLGIYAFIYIFGGYSIYITKDFLGLQVALTGAIALWTVSFFLILDIIFKWTEVKIPEKKSLRYISWFFLFGGIFLYPVVEMATGFLYPRMVFFGAECPTTISLIGLFIGSIPKVNKPLFILISINAMFTGLSVAIYGAYFDYFYGLAGIFGTLLMIIYFKDIFLKRQKQ